MKKTLMVLVVISALLITACSGGRSGQQGQQSEVQKAEPIVLMIGYENNPGEPVDQGILKWKELVEQQGDGSLRIEAYPSSQLGSKNEIIDQMIAGDPVATIADGSFYADRGVPDFSISMAPYIFDSWEECWKLVRSDWWKQQIDKLAEKGIRIMCSNWEYGTRHTLTTTPVKKVADLKGKKIRVANSTPFIVMYTAMGAVPTPMALGEVYIALQQGVIDGLENPLGVLYNGKFHESAKYLILDGHVMNSSTWICGTSFWKSLTDAQRELLASTGNAAGEYNNQIVTKIDEEMIEKFKKEGVTIVTPDAATKEEFRKATESFYSNPEIINAWTPGLYDTIRAITKG